MKERPILFSGPMVRAILEGRKTMTRRILKPQPDMAMDGEICPDGSGGYSWEPVWPQGHKKAGKIVCSLSCPYGGPGDRLWVRESWALTHPSFDYETQCVDEFIPFEGKIPKEMPDSYWKVVYGANFNEMQVHKDDRFIKNWKPSIHMPRWASRLTLEIVDVRPERLQEITEEDVVKEGIQKPYCSVSSKNLYQIWVNGKCIENEKAAFVYQSLWNSINGPGSWEANPWIWTIEFKRITEVRRERD
jgi:hypothetical protein